MNIVDKKIVAVRPMAVEECANESPEWTRQPENFPIICLELDDGARVFAHRTDNDTRPGILVGQTASGELATIESSVEPTSAEKPRNPGRTHV